MVKYVFEDFDPREKSLWKKRFENLVTVLNGEKGERDNYRTSASKAARWIEDYTGKTLDRERLGLPARKDK